MIVNDQPLPSNTPGSTLDETIAGFLDSARQDALAEDVTVPLRWHSGGGGGRRIVRSFRWQSL